MKNIKTLEALAEYINGKDEWPTDVEAIIEKNGWVSDTGTQWGVCHSETEKIVLDDEGHAEVIQMQKKKVTKNVTLRLPSEMVEYIDKGDGINQGVKDIIETLRRHEQHADLEIRGKLTKGEWGFLFDTMNGVKVLDDFRFNKNVLMAHNQDAEVFDKSASKWSVDVAELNAKIEKLSAAQVEAVYRRIEKFWDSCEGLNFEKYLDY